MKDQFDHVLVIIIIKRFIETFKFHITTVINWYIFPRIFAQQIVAL